MKGETSQALVDYTKAIEINPHDAAAYNNRGMALAKLGELESALTDFTHSPYATVTEKV
jgi:Flp pilus assembly protein TadD